MHQPHADRKVSLISLSLTNGDPCPDFRSGKGGREIENQGGSRTQLPVYTPAKQRSLCFSHTASSMNMSHCPVTSHCPKSAKPSLACGTRQHLQTTTHHKHDPAKKGLPATRILTRQTGVTACTDTHRGTRQPTQTKTLSDPSFRPSGSLRFDPPHALG